MKHYSILTLLLLWVISPSLSAQTLFPTPANYQRNKGEFIITKATKTYGNQMYADKMASQVSTNLTQSNENAPANVIAFFIDPQLKLADEGYILQVKNLLHSAIYSPYLYQHHRQRFQVPYMNVLPLMYPHYL